MDSTIKGALITAAATLVASVLPYLIWLFRGTRRLSRFVGVWTGQGIQNTEQGNAARTYEIRLEIKSRRKIFLKLHRRDEQYIFENNLACKVISIDGELLLLQYKNIRSDARQFGCVMFKLSGDGNYLHGNLVGYGIKAELPVLGQMELNRA